MKCLCLLQIFLQIALHGTTQAADMKLSLEVRPIGALSGESITMNCLLPAGKWKGYKVFLWYRNEKLIARNNQAQYIIRRAKRSDAASYRCELQINYRKWISLDVNVSVTVPVAGAVLASNSNNTGISAGDLLVLHCQVKAGTEPRFHWYLNNQQLQNTSESYQINTDGSVLIIESFQRGHGGRYHCVATNQGANDLEFNTTSNFIDVKMQASDTKISLEVSPKVPLPGENITMNCLLQAGKWTGPKVCLWYRNDKLIARNNQSQYTIRRAKISDGASYRCELQIHYRKWTSPEVNFTVTVQSYTTTITALFLSPFLIAFLIVLILHKRRNKTKDNFSSFSLPPGESTRNENQPSSEGSSPNNCMPAFVASATNIADDNTAADLTYSMITATKSSVADNGAGVSGAKRHTKSGSSGHSVAYSVVNREEMEASLEGNQLEEANGRDANVYENLPRKQERIRKKKPRNNKKGETSMMLCSRKYTDPGDISLKTD
ncbi:Fc receptor-like protein 3 isoform X2 [Heterodontus francisci]|uniref:Fc receptor-like protein 3 isoform X2 n=1 Tax=Heterodontus francisci TaxID=7792 RepID=UPI00355C7635